jgi:branched-chain amino acid transport system permease protein
VLPAAKGAETLPEILREAALAGIIALLLGLPIVGMKTVDNGMGGLTLRFLVPDVVVGAFLVFLGRVGFALAGSGRGAIAAVAGLVVGVASLFVVWPSDFLRVAAVGGGFAVALRGAWIAWRGRPRAEGAAAREAENVAAFLMRIGPFVGPVLILAAIAFPFAPFTTRYMLDVGILVMTYVMLGWGLNIVVGLAGLLDLGYVAFYAVGAYSYALLAQYHGLTFWECLPLAGAFAAMFGVLLGFPVLRLRGDYLAIVTLGFGEIIRVVLLNWTSFTNGPNGIGSIPRPSFFGIPFTANPPEGTLAFHQLFGLDFSPNHRFIYLYYVILFLALVVNVFTLRIRRLPVGRAWEALREDEIACRSLGINPTNTKLTAFATGAMFAGFAGAFFATRQGFISPESFSFIESAIILAIVVLGGMGSQLGVVAAALLVIGLPELFRELQGYRMLAFGVGMVLIMIWRPRGLLSHREPTIRLGAEARP